ncbi:MAG: coproporphyrinogen dehydrogenase HemZ [Defluviitaleaceae bacterium]|nr:coproporphyrinogen dehydrogenase HemZ [Defluviitaleaceae bacterium]
MIQQDKQDRITCILNGHNYTHDVQVITQVFFANVKFAFLETSNLQASDETIPNSGYAVVSTLSGKFCTGELYCDGKQISTHTLKLPESTIMITKRTIMLALFNALKEATNKPTPWGTLTGVRPAKKVRMWLEEGITEEVIAKWLKDIYQCREDKIQLAINVAGAEEKLISKYNDSAKVGIYIGIPFCPGRCLYCSFVTAQKNGEDVHSRYLNALAKECESIDANSINTIYIGGGTPTVLSERDLEKLLKICTQFTKISKDVEYTVEAGRPDSLNKEKLALLKEYGVTRIAINPQTLSDETLKRIGRAHTAKDFYKAYEMAQQAGFDNINTDIIAGLPGETPDDMQRTMEGLKKIAPAHITVHTLAVKRASKLNENRPVATDISSNIGDFETIDAMLAIAQKVCEDLKLSPYYMYRQKNMVGHFENIGYCLPGYECLYNVAMMAETQTVLAAGAGAVTKIVEDTQNGSLIKRKFNPKDVETYIERINQTNRTDG